MRAFVGLGANLGDARDALAAAVQALAALPDITQLRRSPLYRSAPVDSSGPDYLNAVVSMQTALAPQLLLGELQRIEKAHGRERPYRNAPRTLDLDLLLYGDELIDSETLTVPHPRLHQRAFVLRPLADLAPDLILPGQGPIRALLAAVAEQHAERLA